MIGTYKYGNGDVYEGEWNDDIKVGKGLCFVLQFDFVAVLYASPSKQKGNG